MTRERLLRSSAAIGLGLVAILGCGGAGPAEEPPAAGAPDAAPFGLTPAAEVTLLAPGVLTTEEGDELFATFDVDGATVYFVRRVPGGVYTIVASSYRAGGWSEPEVVPFSGSYKDQAPFLAPDGSRLYFYSNRPRSGRGEPREDDDIWWADRTADGSWGAPLNPGPPLNSEESERHPTVNAAGNLYFWTRRPDSRGATDLYRAAPAADGGYGEPENLGDTLNTDAYEANPWISPDGDLLLFTSDDRPDGLGRGDIYVSRRTGEGWSTPRNLGPEVNSPQYDFAPRLTPDGRYLVFSSNRGPADGGLGGHDLFYVSVDALEVLQR